MTDIHSCSYYCDRPGCIKAQRDELRDSNGAGNQVPPCTQPAPAQEPDMRHPKIQALIGGRARLAIQLQLVEQLLEDPNFETTSMDMEHWGPLHDKLKAALTAQEVEELQALCDRLSDILTRTANSLKGPPPPLTLHDWSDLPEVAAAQRLSDARIMKIVREASKGSALRRDGTTSMRIARAVEAAIVPPGYVVVPMEPTQGMSRAGGMAVLRTYYAGPERSIHPEEDDVATATAAYRAMFAAAQKAQP